MAQTINGILSGIFVAYDLNSLITKRKEVVRVLDNGLEGDKHTQ